jgi:type II secretory pathway predicted ATPase ExeA
VNHQSFAGSAAEVRVKSTRLAPFISHCYRPALQRLGQAFVAMRPAAVLVSEGRIAPSLLIDNFVGKLNDEVTVVRVPGPIADATACMRHIITGIGFESARMSLGELEGVLEMFLVFQRKKKQRTIICFENSHTSDWWVLDKIQRLIELEAREKYGLMIIQTDLPNGNSGFAETAGDTAAPQFPLRIVLSPFSPAETREFIRQRVESPDANEFRVDDVSQIFEFFAVTLIHDFSAGVPEYVEKLCSTCLRLMRDAGDSEVSTDTVRTAAKILGMHGAMRDESPVRNGTEAGGELLLPGRLVVHSPGEAVEEVPLDQNCILIGRDRLCAVCVSGLKVSRYHALVALSSHGVQLVDLGSTNGTKVNGQKIERCTVRDNDVITIGKIRIRYVAGAEQLTWASDNAMARDFEIEDETAEPSINYIGPDVQLLRTLE